MADQVDRSLSTSGSPAVTPSPQTTEAAPAPPKQDPAKPGNGRDQRIEQLIREKYEIRRELDQVKALIAERAPKESPPDPRSEGPITSVEQLSENDLNTVLSQGAEQNPQGFAMAIRELTRRAEIRAAKSASEQAVTQTRLQLERDQVEREIATRFGQDALTQSSDLWQKANAIYMDMQRDFVTRFGEKQGLEMIASMPKMQKRAFELADRERVATENAQLPELRRGADRLKQYEALQSGIGRPVEREQTLQDALRRKDRKAIFENLPFVKSIGKQG